MAVVVVAGIFFDPEAHTMGDRQGKGTLSEFLAKFAGTRPVLEPTVSAAVVLRRLAAIETEASAYYEGLSRHSDLPWVRKFAAELAAAEKGHERHFLELADIAERDSSPDGAMRAPLTDEIVELLSVRITQTPKSAARTAVYIGEKDAVDFAVQAEINTISLLMKLLDHVPTAQRPHITRVMEEEMAHKTYLDELRDRHFPSAADGNTD